MMNKKTASTKFPSGILVLLVFVGAIFHWSGYRITISNNKEERESNRYEAVMREVVWSAQHEQPRLEVQIDNIRSIETEQLPCKSGLVLKKTIVIKIN